MLKGYSNVCFCKCPGWIPGDTLGTLGIPVAPQQLLPEIFNSAQFSWSETAVRQGHW